MVSIKDVTMDPEAAIAEGDIKKCDIDVSHKEAASVAPYIYVPNTPEEKKLIRKIDAHLFPMLWLMFLMNYLDRTNIGVSRPQPCGRRWDLARSSHSYTPRIQLTSRTLRSAAWKRT